MGLKITPYIVDKKIDLAEAKAIENEARVGGPGPLKVSEKAQKEVAEVLKNPDIFIAPDARPVLEGIATAAVEVKAADPTKRTKLFKSDEPLKLKLTSDFAKLFSEKHGAGRNPGFAGTLEIQQDGAPKSIPVNVRTRGQSSLDYMPEPKLKIKLDKAAREGTDFEKEGSLEIGVQGGAGGKDGLGRVLIPEAPPREAATYALLDEMGLVVPRARVANFDYVDSQGKVRSQPAFLNEDADSLAKRWMGDKGVEAGNIGNNDQMPNLRATIQTKDVLRLNLGLLLIANRDWVFGTNGTFDKPTVTSNAGRMHNSKMIYVPDPMNPNAGEGKPVATDFDLSMFVLQEEYAGYWKNQQKPVNYPAELKQLRAQFPGPQFKEVLNDVISRQGKMLARLEQYPLDEKSKAFMREKINAFMTAAKAEVAI